MSGAVQVAVMVVVLLAFMVGVPGRPIGSFTSVTLMVTVMVSSLLVSGLWSASMPSWTFTFTE